MQKIDKHISELLHEHDLVIVPNFGGFLTNYSSATIHSNHIFSPPSKHVVFNSSLKNNDGLLANHISSTETISYPEAIARVEKFVLYLNSTLKKGEKVKLETIGVLTMDTEQNIQFKPGNTNFHIDSFGLTEFQSPAIKQETLSKRIEMGIKNETKKVVNINSGVNGKKKINYKRIVGIAASILITTGVVWVSLKTDILKDVNYANLNPFTLKAKDTIIVTTTRIDSQIKKIKAVDVPTEEVVGVEPIDETIAPVEKTTTHVTEAKAESNSSKHATNIATDFHIVAGSFKMEANALKYVEILEKENLSSSVIGQNKQGYYIVSCGDFTTKKEAKEKLQELSKQKSNLWVYKSN